MSLLAIINDSLSWHLYHWSTTEVSHTVGMKSYPIPSSSKWAKSGLAVSSTWARTEPSGSTPIIYGKRLKYELQSGFIFVLLELSRTVPIILMLYTRTTTATPVWWFCAVPCDRACLFHKEVHRVKRYLKQCTDTCGFTAKFYGPRTLIGTSQDSWHRCPHQCKNIGSPHIREFLLPSLSIDITSLTTSTGANRIRWALGRSIFGISLHRGPK